ncbi:NRAMP family divalent metal transporter [Reyranella sp.]|uniref:NRAMP family divalent metal transporter n=1 Tax=Reyranella sp. TaxID=1929291 RepID=UPI003BA963FB
MTIAQTATQAANPQPSRWSLEGLFKRLGPGVITGAADDDPSGIATYSQAGAHSGFGLLWTVVLTWPLMVAVQSVSARIGRVTGRGLAANMVQAFPRWVVTGLVGLLFVANTINLGADLAAMGAATKLVLGGSARLYAVLFALGSLAAIVFIPYHRYVGLLKWFTFSLLAYVGVVFAARIDWLAVAHGAFVPQVKLTGESLTLVVAIFGTTISPYLFFWQSSQEVEDEEADPDAAPLKERPDQAERELNRIGWETWVGMAMSNLIAFFIILTTAVTLHAHGKLDVESAEQAAEALKPIAGEAAFVLFSLGLIGTGLLAVPVLAGSVAYALAEVRGWRSGLERPLHEARPFYLVIALAILVGVGLGFTPLTPIKALLWSAVVNGVIVVPIMVAMMIVASRPKIMGSFVAAPWQRILGWAATAVMAAAAVAMFVAL